MDTFELLTLSGLSKKEAAVYEALLEYGVLSLSDISRKTHINRPALYNILPKLQSEGLLSGVQKQKRLYYKAESPNHLIKKYTSEQSDVLTRLKSLAKTYNTSSSEKPVLKYFDGMKGVKFIFDDIVETLPRGGVYYRYTSRTGEFTHLMNDDYQKKRDAKHIERMVIASEEKAREKQKKLDRAVKSVPKEFDLFEDNISLAIYGDKTAYIDYESNTSFIIESAKISRFQEKLFKLLWKHL